MPAGVGRAGTEPLLNTSAVTIICAMGSCCALSTGGCVCRSNTEFGLDLKLFLEKIDGNGRVNCSRGWVCWDVELQYFRVEISPVVFGCCQPYTKAQAHGQSCCKSSCSSSCKQVLEVTEVQSGTCKPSLLTMCGSRTCWIMESLLQWISCKPWY